MQTAANHLMVNVYTTSAVGVWRHIYCPVFLNVSNCMHTCDLQGVCCICGMPHSIVPFMQF